MQAKGVIIKLKKKKANSVGPDETVHPVPSHLALEYLQKCLFWSARLKALAFTNLWANSGSKKLILFFFAENKTLTLHASCLPRRQFA